MEEDVDVDVDVDGRGDVGEDVVVCLGDVGGRRHGEEYRDRSETLACPQSTSVSLDHSLNHSIPEGTPWRDGSSE